MTEEEELRSSVQINLDLHQVTPFFKLYNSDTKEIVYFREHRYKDGHFQKKIVLDRQCRSFLPGIKTSYIKSRESLPHTCQAKFALQESPGRLACRDLTMYRESCAKLTFSLTGSSCITATVYTRLNKENKALTVLNLECEHPCTESYDFMFRHPTGVTYRRILKEIWRQYHPHFVISTEKNEKIKTASLLTQPVIPSSVEDVQIYDGFLKKLDGQAGVLGFSGTDRVVTMANRERFRIEDCRDGEEVHFPWSDQLEVRIERIIVDGSISKIYSTDMLRGSHGEILSALPFIYRYKYLKYLSRTALKNIETNPTFRAADQSLSELKNADGIVTFRWFAPAPMIKLKWEYTVDLLCRRPGILVSREGTEYVVTSQESKSGCIYECAFTPSSSSSSFRILKIRLDKTKPDSDETVRRSRSIPWTVSNLWPDSRQIGNLGFIQSSRS